MKLDYRPLREVAEDFRWSQYKSQLSDLRVARDAWRFFECEMQVVEP